MHDAPKEKSGHDRYRELGGIINEKDYESVLTRAEQTTSVDKVFIEQVKLVAETAGIMLHDTRDAIDQRTIVYGILRADTKPKEVQYHHSQMCDQRLFAEALRILGDTDALSKLIDAYHKGGTYCPICLKVIASGEECR